MANAVHTSTTKKVASIAMAIALIGGCATQVMAQSDNESDVNSNSADLETTASAYLGPKKSIAIVEVAGNGAFHAQYGHWSEGTGLAAMLASELAQSNRFRVVNRSHLGATYYEQEIAARGLTARQTARPNQLIGAQYLVRASVTEFTMSEKGGGISIGGNIGGALGSIAPRRQKGRIAIDFTVVDSTTGEVVTSFPMTKKLKSTAIAASITRNNLSVGGDSFKNSPLGKAARELMTEAAYKLADALKDEDWTAQVAQVRADALYVNAGADSGLRPGDRFKIERVIDRIEDPVTGALLGIEKHVIGEAVVTNVANQYATAQYHAAYAPQTGDLVTIQPAMRVSYNNQ